MPLSSRAGYRKRDNYTGRVVGSSGMKIFTGKTNAACDKGTNASVSLYMGQIQGSEADTGQDFTVYNRFADIEADKWCLFCKVGSGYEMIAAEC